MNILIDIGHPAHVHLFRCFAHEMLTRGHKVLFTCRDKEFEIALLKAEGFEYISFGKKYSSKLGKILGLLKFDCLEWKTCLQFKPDILLSHGSMYAAHAAWLYGRPHISFEDTYNFEKIRLYEPFTVSILTADYEHPFISKKEIHYAGYHELAYLHPKRFTPDKSVLAELGLIKDEKYVLLRFVSWKATHDSGHKGMSIENKRRAVRLFSQYAKVFISSEKDLPEDLQCYRLPTPPERIHHVMAFSSLIFGESATMVSEGVVLGVPGIYMDNTGRYYTREQEVRYGMCFNFSESLEDQDRAINKGVEILSSSTFDNSGHEQMLKEKIDVTGFLVDFVENWPISKQRAKDNPDYQYRFK